MYKLKANYKFSTDPNVFTTTCEHKNEAYLEEIRHKAKQVFRDAITSASCGTEVEAYIIIGHDTIRTRQLQTLEINISKVLQSENPLNDPEAS